MPYARDPTTGKAVWIEDGKVVLRDSAGRLTRVAPEAAGALIQSGDREAATEEQVAQRRYVKEHGEPSQLRAGAEAAAAGAFDAATAIVRAPSALVSALAGVEDPLGHITGRNLLSDVAAVGGEGASAAGLTELTGEAIAGEYERGARAAAREYPTTASVGRIAGELIGGGPLARGASALTEGAGALARTAAGAVEGGTLGATESQEAAWLNDTELTSEQVLAGIGLGTFFGAAAGGVGDAFAARARRKATNLDRVFGETPSAKAPIADYELAAREVIGDEVAAAPNIGQKLREAVEDVQSVASGADRETLRKYGALRWDDEAIEGGQLWRNRARILEDASADITAQTSRIVDKADDVFDEVVNAGLKRAHIASRLEGNAAEQLGAARKQLSSLSQAFEDLPEDIARRLGPKNLRKLFADLTQRMDVTNDPAEAFIVLDRAKRALQKEHVAVGGVLGRQTDEYMAGLLRDYQHTLNTLQEQPRQLLMNEQLWGKAAADQRAINGAFEEYLRYARFFDSKIATKTGRRSDGRPILEIDPEKVSSYVNRLGRKDGVLLDKAFRQHVSSARRLSATIGDSFDLSAGKQSAIREVADAADVIGKTLDRADRTVRVANQIDDVINANRSERFGALTGGAAGGMFGGVPGAIAGTLYGGVVNPGKLIQQRAALVHLLRNVDGRIVNSVRSFLKAPKLSFTGISGKARRVAQRTPVSAVFMPFTHDEEAPRAFRARVKQLTELAANDGAKIQDIAVEHAGAGGPRTRDVASMMTAKATNAVNYLVSQIPPIALDPNAQRLGIDFPEPQTLSSFMQKWDGAFNPLTLLDDLESGRVDPDKIEAVKATAPRLWQDIRTKFMQHLTELDTPPEYDVRAQLDMLLEANGTIEPSLSPGLLRVQARLKQYIDQEAQQRPKPRPSAAPSKYPTQLLTRTDAALGAL